LNNEAVLLNNKQKKGSYESLYFKKDNYLFPSSGPIIINLYDWIGSKRIKMFSDMHKTSP